MPLSTRPARLPRNVQRLIALARSLSQSTSRVEDTYWENLLATQLHKLLQGRPNHTVEQALDTLLDQDTTAYEVLADQAETASESTTLVHASREYDVLLLAAPILVWTRYRLPDIDLNARMQQTVQSYISDHIAAPDAHTAMIPALLNVNQLPQSFQEVLCWTQRLGQQALGQAAEITITPPMEAEAEYTLADVRFLVFALVAPKGEALFRWQTPPDGIRPARATCLQRWQKQCQEALTPLFTGCQAEVRPPDTFYSGNREADRRIRPLVIQATVTWLQTVTSLAASDLRATIVACGYDRAEEFRVGFCTTKNTDVIYGCVWPVLSYSEAMLDGTDELPDVPDEIAALLTTLGLEQVKRLPGLYPPETCEDCGTPYFPNPLGEMQHPELPQDAETRPVSLH